VTAITYGFMIGSPKMDDLFKALKEDPGMIERVLNPGKYLHQADPKSLEIHTMPSGFDCLDRDTMLLKRDEGELIIVCGEASMGKSSLMLKIAFNVSKDRPVHIFSLEDSYESIVRRRVSAMSNITISDIQRGLNPSLVQSAIDDLKEYNFFVDDQGGLGIDEICERARNRHRKVKTELIVVDHLQVIGSDPSHSRAQEVGNMTYKLKALGKELRCPVLLACQMNRAYAGRENKKPMLSDLKESSSIEQNSDIVLSVYREYRHTKLRQFEADIGVLKNRNGPVSDFVFGFKPSLADFYELDPGI
jgi:replicative DNA helicase